MTPYTPADWARLATAIEGGDLAPFLDGCADWDPVTRLHKGARVWVNRSTDRHAMLPVEDVFPDDAENRRDALLAAICVALGLRRRADDAVFRLAAVLVLHHPDGHEYRRSQGSTRRCTCGLPHPCPTFQALFPPGTAPA